MKVLYDYQGFMQRHGGVSRYFVELIQAMTAAGDFEAVLPPFFTDNQYLERTRTFLTSRHFKGKVRLMRVLNRRISLRSLEGEYDLFHPTYFQPYFLGRLRAPFVVTVHDMIHHLYGGEHVRDDGTRENLAVLCRKASRVIAVSQATKDDLCRLTDTPEAKVTVIHHGTSLRWDGDARLHSRRYVLWVGERGGYKNFSSFISSVAGLLTSADLDLLCAGSRPFTREESVSLESAGVDSRVRHVEVSTAGGLASLYHFAEALCYPSLHEGFGMPLLEAFSCGCPVAVSNIPPFREVAGDAAQYFDPRDPASVRSALERVITDRARASELARQGRERLAEFSWEKAARSTLEVYRSAI